MRVPFGLCEYAGWDFKCRRRAMKSRGARSGRILTFAAAFIESLVGRVAREGRTRMKISLEWLSEYVAGALREIGAERAGEALMNGGLPVESIEARGDDVVIDVEVTSNRSD